MSWTAFPLNTGKDDAKHGATSLPGQINHPNQIEELPAGQNQPRSSECMSAEAARMLWACTPNLHLALHLQQIWPVVRGSSLVLNSTSSLLKALQSSAESTQNPIIPINPPTAARHHDSVHADIQLSSLALLPAA